MQHLYACSFTVIDRDPSDVARQVAGWAIRSDGPDADAIASPGSATIEDRTVSWTPLGDEQANGVEVVLEHPDSAAPSLTWRTTVELHAEGTDSVMTLRLGRAGDTGRIAPASVTLRRPKILIDLLRGGARSGSVALSSHAERLLASDVPAYVRDVVMHPDRALPVIALAVPPGRERPIIDPDRLADELAGLAHVCVLAGHLARQRFNEELRHAQHVPYGGARLLWTVETPDDRDLWWSRSRLDDRADRLEAELLSRLSRLAVLHVPADPVLAELRSRSAQRARQELASSRSLTPDIKELLDLADEEVDKAERKRDQAKADAGAALERADELELKLESAKTENARLRVAMAQIAGATSVAIPVDTGEGTEITSWQDVHDHLDEVCGPHMQITDRARKMVLGNPYRDPARMFEHLQLLGDVAREWRRKNRSVGGRLVEFASTEAGIDIALQQSSLKGSDSFSYDGEQMSNMPHVKIDDGTSPDHCGRIHWGIDKTNNRFVVDHIGTHR